MKVIQIICLATLVGAVLFTSASNVAFATEPECFDCDGKVDNMIMRYDGDVLVFVEVFGLKGSRTASVFAGTVGPAQQFVLSGADNFLDNKGTLGANISIWVDGVEANTLHTSCSQPIGPGTIVGDFVVIAATSRNGGLTCPTGPIPEPPCNPRDLSCSGGA